MESSKFIVQSSNSSLVQPCQASDRLTPHSSRLTASSGFTYLALLTAVAITGILLGAAGKYWSAVMAREKEEELLFRGNQYRIAIERYYKALPGRQQFPANIEDLLKDNRSAAGKRHLRQQYKDPVTGEEFEEIRDKLRGNRIAGVRSKSDKKPIRQKNFPDLYKEFEGKEKYSEWEFKYLPAQMQPALRPVPGGAGGRPFIMQQGPPQQPRPSSP